MVLALQHSRFRTTAIELWFDVGAESVKVTVCRLAGALREAWLVELSECWSDEVAAWVPASGDVPASVVEWIDEHTDELLAQWIREVA